MGPWKVQFDAHGLGGYKGHASLHGTAGNPAFPGQDGLVGHKGHQVQPPKLPADELLVLGQVNDCLYLAGPAVLKVKYAFGTPGKEVKEYFNEFA